MMSTASPLPLSSEDTRALQQRLADLEARVQRTEDAAAIRACVTRYMELCDHLDAHTPMDELMDCFTEDAVWAGKGARYGASFGGHQGRAAIGEMLGRYRGSLPGEALAEGDSAPRPPHFALNVHFLCSELITPTGEGQALARWVMLQTSTFATGASHLNAAQLNLRMARCRDGRWRIAHFETENLFSRPVDHWQSSDPLPVPDRSR
jgi:ketosteroid isomerase-like protein